MIYSITLNHQGPLFYVLIIAIFLVIVVFNLWDLKHRRILFKRLTENGALGFVYELSKTAKVRDCNMSEIRISGTVCGKLITGTLSGNVFDAGDIDHDTRMELEAALNIILDQESIQSFGPKLHIRFASDRC